MPGTHVRKAHQHDAERIADLHVRSIRELASTVYEPDVIDAWSRPKDPDRYAIAEDGVYFLVAEVDGTVAGFGELRTAPDTEFSQVVDGEIGALYVDPAFVNRGIGSAIYEELREQAVRLDMDSLGLWASLNAVGFYESRGFEVVRSFTHAFGGVVEAQVMEMYASLYQ